MRNWLSIVFLVGLSTLLFAQSKIPNDTLQVGKGSTASDKGLIFDTNDGVSNPKLQVDKTTKALKYDKNTLQIGDGSSGSDKTITINGASKNLKFNGTLNQFEFDDDVKTSGKIKTDTIEAVIAGSPVAVENDLRAKQKLFIGTSTNELRVSGGNLQFSNDGSTYTSFQPVTAVAPDSSESINILTNAGFEDGISTGWIAATPAAASANYTASATGNSKYATWDATTTGQNLRSSLVTKPENISGRCRANFSYNGGDANLTFKALNATATPIASQVLSTHAAWARSPTLVFDCASSMQFSLESTANAASISLDDVYLGSHFYDSVETSYSAGVRDESCRIDNNGTATINNESGLCAWVSSVSHPGTGTVNVNFVSGIFPVVPVCKITGQGGRVCTINLGNNTATFAEITCTNAGAGSDINFNIACTGSR